MLSKVVAMRSYMARESQRGGRAAAEIAGCRAQSTSGLADELLNGSCRALAILGSRESSLWRLHALRALRKVKANTSCRRSAG